MITFRLLDYTASKESIVQINPNHIVSVQCEIDYEHIVALGDYGYIAHISYELVNGKQLETAIIGLDGTFSHNEFIAYVKNSLNFEVIYFKWSN